MTGRAAGPAGMGAALAAALSGSVLALLAAGRIWGAHTFTAAGGGRQHVTVHGHDVAASLPALATAALVLTIGVVAVRSWLRRVVGLLVVVAGGALLGVALTARGDVGAALARQAFASPNVVVAAGHSAWPWVAAVGAALVVAGGAATAVLGHRWPALGRRYDAPAVAVADDDDAMWAALDRGDDPTA
jgi:uncharacterized membrane protein (TIGR02234 family)